MRIDIAAQGTGAIDQQMRSIAEIFQHFEQHAPPEQITLLARK